MASGNKINIPLQRPTSRTDILENIEQVLLSHWWTEGKWTERFEWVVKKFIEAKHAIAVPNATVGLEMVIRYLSDGINPTFIIPAYTHSATAQAVLLGNGFMPVFCDIDRRTGLMAFDKLVNTKLSGQWKVVIPVSLFGNPITESHFIKYFNGRMIEDAACSLGSKNADGGYVGSEGTAVFSFHPRKIISTGEGGMIVTDDDYIAEFCRKFKNFGGPECDMIGTNYKMTDFLGAIGVSQMEDLQWILDRRRHLAERYHAGLIALEKLERIRFLKTTGTPNYQSYVIDVTKDRDEVRLKLLEMGIETQIGSHYLPSLKYFRENFAIKAAFPGAKYADEHYLTLPLYPLMNYKDQDKVIDGLYKVMKSE